MEIRKNNPELKSYVENFIIKKLENCELFVKTYGKGFARERLRTNFKRLYTDELNPKNSGQYLFDTKSIILFSKGTDGNLLSSEDIDEDERIASTTLHEGVHAVFNKTKRECKSLKILKGSGIHYIFNKNEIGRGLNEGFTNWVCLMAGENTFGSYRALTNIVYLLEVALGREKVMQFPKGDIEHDLSSLLNMSTEECVNFLTKCDSIYNYNDIASDYHIAIALLSTKINNKQKNPTYGGQNTRELNNNYLYRRLSKDSEYLIYAQAYNLDPKSDESKLEFLQKKYEAYKNQSQKMVGEVYAIIIDKYFMQEIDKLLSEEVCSYKDFLKMNFLPQHLSVGTNGENEVLKQFIEKQKRLKEKVEKKSMEDFKASLERGEISAETLAICHTLAFTKDYDSLKKFQEDLSKIMLPETPELYENFLNALGRCGSIKNIFDYKFLELETENGNKKTLFFDERQGYHFTRRPNGNNEIQANEEIEDTLDLFNMTIGLSQDIQEIIANFIKLKESISQKNPNAKIQIVNDVIVVTDDKNEMSYYVIEGNEFSLAQSKEILPESRKTIKVIRPPETTNVDLDDKENNQEHENDIGSNATENSATSLIPFSQNSFRSFLENIKTKIMRIFSRKHKNEEESKCENEIPTEMNSYKSSSEDFNNRLHVDTPGKYNPEEQIQGNTPKEKDIDYTK